MDLNVHILVLKTLIKAGGLLESSVAAIITKLILEYNEGLKTQDEGSQEENVFADEELKVALVNKTAPGLPMNLAQKEIDDLNYLQHRNQLKKYLLDGYVPQLLRGHVWLSVANLRSECWRQETPDWNRLACPTSSINIRHPLRHKIALSQAINMCSTVQRRLTCPKVYVLTYYLILRSLYEEDSIQNENECHPLAHNNHSGLPLLLPILCELLTTIDRYLTQDMIDDLSQFVDKQKLLPHCESFEDTDLIEGNDSRALLQHLLSSPLKRFDEENCIKMKSRLSFPNLFVTPGSTKTDDISEDATSQVSTEKKHTQSNVTEYRDDNVIIEDEIKDVVLSKYLAGFPSSCDFITLHEVVILCQHISRTFLVPEKALPRYIRTVCSLAWFFDIEFAEAMVEDLASLVPFIRVALTTMFIQYMKYKKLLYHIDCHFALGRAAPVMFLLGYLKRTFNHERELLHIALSFEGSPHESKIPQNGFNLSSCSVEKELRQIWSDTRKLHKHLPDGMVETTLDNSTLTSDENILISAAIHEIEPTEKFFNGFEDRGMGHEWKRCPYFLYRSTPCFIEASSFVKAYTSYLRDPEEVAPPILVDLRTYKDQCHSGSFIQCARIDSVHDPSWPGLINALSGSDKLKGNLIVLCALDEMDSNIVVKVHYYFRMRAKISNICVVRGGWTALHDELFTGTKNLKKLVTKHIRDKCYLCMPRGTRGIRCPSKDYPRTPLNPRMPEVARYEIFDTEQKISEYNKRRWKKIIDTSPAAAAVTSMEGQKRYLPPIKVYEQYLSPTSSRERPPRTVAMSLLGHNEKKKKRKLRSLTESIADVIRGGRSDVKSDGTPPTSARGLHRLLPTGAMNGIVTSINHYKKAEYSKHPKPAHLIWYLKYLCKNYGSAYISHVVISGSKLHDRLVKNGEIPALCEFLLPVLPKDKLKSDAHFARYQLHKLSSSKLYKLPVWISITEYGSICMILREQLMHKHDGSNDGSIHKKLTLPKSKQDKLFMLFDTPLDSIKKAYRLDESNDDSVQGEEQRELHETMPDSPLRLVFKGRSGTNYNEQSVMFPLMPDEVDSIWEIYTVGCESRDGLVRILEEHAMKKKRLKRREREYHQQLSTRGKPSISFGLDESKPKDAESDQCNASAIEFDKVPVRSADPAYFGSLLDHEDPSVSTPITINGVPDFLI